MEYIQVDIQIPDEATDIIVAELAGAGYDSFEEQPGILSAYVDKSIFSEEVLDELLAKYTSIFPANYTYKLLENKNWNEIWESNFHPITIADKCLVRASFHNTEKTYP